VSSQTLYWKSKLFSCSKVLVGVMVMVQLLWAYGVSERGGLMDVENPKNMLLLPATEQILK